MKTVAVEMRLGEAMSVSPIAFQAIAGNWRKALIPAAIGMAVGLLIAPTVGAIILLSLFLVAGPQAATATEGYHEPFYVTLEIAAGIIGWRIGENRGVKRNFDRFLKGLRERGSPDESLNRFSIAPEGLRLETERGTLLAAWPSVVELFATNTHWLLQTDLLTLALPRRAFASPQKEREFIEALASHLESGARQRSAPALAQIGVPAI